MRRQDILMVIIIFILSALATTTMAQSIEKTWYDSKKSSKVQIFKGNDGKFYGKITWLDKPTDKTGKTVTDKENPDENLRSKPLVGMTLLTGFEQDPKNKNVFIGGSVYDPGNGKTYCGKMTFKGTKLDLKGYICSFSLFGRTEEWTSAE